MWEEKHTGDYIFDDSERCSSKLLIVSHSPALSERFCVCCRIDCISLSCIIII